VEQLLKLPARTKLSLLAPIVRGRKGQHEDVLADIRRQGFVRVRVDGELHETDERLELEKNKTHTIEAVVDRLIITDRTRSRLTDSVELALKHGKGLMSALVQPEGGEVAEMLREVIPCAEQVRFLKTGGEAIAAWAVVLLSR
jgi:excinuclease ABC subunit A